MLELIPFLRDYLVWVRVYAAFLLLGAVALVLILLFLKPDKPNPGGNTGQGQSVTNSPGATVIQGGRDVIVNQPTIRGIARITQAAIEARLVCTLRDGVALPPAEQDFLPIGDARAYLEGPAGRTGFEFQSPVRFRRQDDNTIVVINRFGLPGTSDVMNRPLDALAGYTTLRVPIVTVVYGNALDRMRLLEVTLAVNGHDVWSYRWPIPDSPSFQQGPVFNVPLATLVDRLRQ